MNRLMIATATSMTFMGSASCCSATCHVDGGFSAAIELGPCSASRCAASAAVSPRSRSLRNAATTASGSWLYHAVSAGVPAVVSTALMA